MESNIKRAINLGTRPTIIDPLAYKIRFCLFIRYYMLGIDKQTCD